MPVVKLAKQAKESGEFYVPRFEVHAKGATVSDAIIRDVTQVTYKDSIREIDSFELTVGNWDSVSRSFKYIDSEADRALMRASQAKGASSETRAAASLLLLRHKLFEPCAHEFELKLGYGSTLTSMTKGSVTTLEPSFPTGGPLTLTVRALNVLHRLRDKQRSRHWKNQTDSQIAKS